MRELLLALALLAGGRHCDMCDRPVHADTRATAQTPEGKKHFCCAACALTARKQRGAAVKITEFTDEESGRPVAAGDAWLVRDSDVNHCARTAFVVDVSKHPQAERFDRCSPSVIAFARRAAAERFIREHGGRLVRLAELQ